MHPNNKYRHNLVYYCSDSLVGFTIIELLVVIAVIGILAAITLVSYSGITNRATIASIQSDLSNASTKLRLYQTENGVLPTTAANAIAAKLISPNPSMDYYSYGVDSLSNPQYFCYMYRKGTDVYAVDSYSAPSDGVCLTNLISNGDFSNGTTGWGTEYSTISASGGVVSDTSNGGNVYAVVSKNCSGCAISGHSIYATFKQRVTNSSALSIGVMIADGASNKSIPSTTSPVINNWYTRSGTVLFTGSGDLVFKPVHGYVDGPTANGKVMEVKFPSVFDLTAIFGIGNEPTKAQMDTIMSSYTDGWVNVIAKANL